MRVASFEELRERSDAVASALPDLGVPRDELESVDGAVAFGAVERLLEPFDPDDGTEIDQRSHRCRHRNRSVGASVDWVEDARDMDGDTRSTSVVAALRMDDLDDVGSEPVEPVQRGRGPMGHAALGPAAPGGGEELLMPRARRARDSEHVT